MMIATSEDDKDDDGNGATGDEVNDDSNGATGDGATGYNDNDDDGGGTMGDEVNDYGEGATGNDDDNDVDDGDCSERCNNIGILSRTQANRGFARLRLCTDEDGTTNNLVLYMVQNDTSKLGGTLHGLRIKREREV